MNIFIIREYFRITKLQDVVSTYRLDLFKAFQSKYPQFPVTIQNLADQRRAIMKKNYIPSAILEKIKNDVKLELSINYSDNNEVSNNLLQNSVEPQSLQSLSNHNDSFCPIIDSPNTIQTDIHNLDLSYNDIHVINKNFYYHQNFKEQIEDEFNSNNLMTKSWPVTAPGSQGVFRGRGRGFGFLKKWAPGSYCLELVVACPAAGTSALILLVEGK
jgi:hypothetical protein